MQARANFRGPRQPRPVAIHQPNARLGRGDDDVNTAELSQCDGVIQKTT